MIVEFDALTRKLINLLEPSITPLGYEIIRLTYTKELKRPTLQILIDRLDGETITVEDCTRVSRSISAILEVEDPIESAYILEVSSPGIDRPLIKLKDFERFKGFEAKIEMSEAINGRKRFQGNLIGLKEENIQILTEGVLQELPFSLVKKAKLLLTDELIAHSLAKHKQENS